MALAVRTLISVLSVYTSSPARHRSLIVVRKYTNDGRKSEQSNSEGNDVDSPSPTPEMRCFELLDDTDPASLSCGDTSWTVRLFRFFLLDVREKSLFRSAITVALPWKSALRTGGEIIFSPSISPDPDVIQLELIGFAGKL